MVDVVANLVMLPRKRRECLLSAADAAEHGDEGVD